MSSIRSLLVFCLVATLAVAQTQSRSISVSGSGTAKAQPNQVMITFEIAAADESAPEALKKFTAKLRLLEKATSTLEVKNVQIDRGTPKFGMKRMDQNGMVMEMNGRGGGEKAPEYEVYEKLSVRLADIDKMDAATRVATTATIVDALSQAGLIRRGTENPYQYGFAVATVNGVMEQSPTDPSTRDFVTFDVADAKAIELEATKQAVADAKRQATVLAELNGVKVGKVLRISMEGPRGRWTKSVGECAVATDIRIEFELVD